jgi:hypothetical protein
MMMQSARIAPPNSALECRSFKRQAAQAAIKNAALETALSGSASQAALVRSQYISIARVMSPNQELMIMTPISRSFVFAFFKPLGGVEGTTQIHS